MTNWLIEFGYGFQLGMQDFNTRYGSHGNLEGTVLKKLKSWEIGPSYEYYFGTNVKEDVLKQLRTPEGDLIGSDHQLVQVDLRLRGMLIGLKLNKELNLKNMPHSFIISIKPGLIMHWIRFQNPGNSFEPIRGIYKYGYDRFSSGWAMQENIAYRYQSQSKLINFEIELNYTHANTTIKRNIQFDRPNLGYIKQKDGLLGMKVKWILPLLKSKDPNKIYY